MAKTPEQKRKHYLHKRVRLGVATAAQKAELATLKAKPVKKGRPRKDEAPAPPPTVAAAGPPLPPAPGLLFSVDGIGTSPSEPGAPAAPEAPTAPGETPPPAAPATPVTSPLKEPTEAAKNLAKTIVKNLLKIGASIEAEFGVPPLLGLDPLVIPVLQRAWAVSLDLWGVAGKLEELGSQETAAQVAAGVSAVYLGGGGLYARYKAWDRQQQIDKAGDANPDPAVAPSAEAAPAEPAPPTFAEQVTPPPPTTSFLTRDRPAGKVNDKGLFEMPPVTTTGAKS